MNRLSQIFDIVDSGQEHIANRKAFYMTVFTILLTSYLIVVSKPGIINLEVVIALAIAIIPIMLITSITIDCITLKSNKTFLKKFALTTIIYIGIYFLLNVLQNRLF